MCKNKVRLLGGLVTFYRLYGGIEERLSRDWMPEESDVEESVMITMRCTPISCALFLAAGTAAAQPLWFTVREPVHPPGVTILRPSGMNNLGQAVGMAVNATGNDPFIWLPAPAYGYPAGISLLNSFGNNSGHATDINDSGQVCGATVWTLDVARWDLGTSPDPIAVFSRGNTRRINNAGIIAGNGGGPFGCPVATLFPGPGTQTLVGNTECANSIVESVNLSGLAVGLNYVGSPLAFFAAPPLYVAQPLPNFPGVPGGASPTRAYGVNDLGQIVGQVGHPTLGNPAIMFQDLNNDSIADPLTEYTILSGPEAGGYTANSINNFGVVVGYEHGFGAGMRWAAGRAHDLNTCVFKRGNGYPIIRAAVDVNDNGEILCVAWTEIGETMVVLTPQCYANCDGSPGQPKLTANDFMCFLNAYASGSPYANCDESTGTPKLTANDFQCFMNQFIVFCP